MNKKQLIVAWVIKLQKGPEKFIENGVDEKVS